MRMLYELLCKIFADDSAFRFFHPVAPLGHPALRIFHGENLVIPGSLSSFNDDLRKSCYGIFCKNNPRRSGFDHFLNDYGHKDRLGINIMGIAVSQKFIFIERLPYFNDGLNNFIFALHTKEALKKTSARKLIMVFHRSR